MPQTQIVIVYSPNQNKRRAVITPDDDSQVPIHTANIVKGEAVLVGSLSDYQQIGPDAMLAAFTGQQPTSDRCIVISPDAVNPTVVAVCLADPLIDTHPLGQLAVDTTGQAYVGLPVVGGVAQVPVAPPPTAQQIAAAQAAAPADSQPESMPEAMP